ncbi:hypothetical protein QUA07_16450 [Microcoleus sp. T3_A4]|uniref:hypothetical protein n=1 Tax=Microcoleus sp. T3_A4 TaxID=2818968 RepID=UPI002FCF1B90
MPNPKGHEDSIKDSRFKAAWQSGPTRTIRVPIVLAEATLYARQLDNGVEPLDTANRIINSKIEMKQSQSPDTRGSIGRASKLKDENETLRLELAELRSQLETVQAENEEWMDGYIKSANENETLRREIQSQFRAVRLCMIWNRDMRVNVAVFDHDPYSPTPNSEPSYHPISEFEKHLWEGHKGSLAIDGHFPSWNSTLLPSPVTITALCCDISQPESEIHKGQQSAFEFELPEAADLLNRLKAKRKKSAATLADIEAILEMIEG